MNERIVGAATEVGLAADPPLVGECRARRCFRLVRMSRSEDLRAHERRLLVFPRALTPTSFVLVEARAAGAVRAFE